MTILDLLTLKPRAIAGAIIIGAVLIMPEVRQYQRNAQMAAERDARASHGQPAKAGQFAGQNLAGSKLATYPVQNSKPIQFTSHVETTP